MILKKGATDVPRDSVRAVQLFEKGCADNVRNACYLASIAHLTGLTAVMTMDARDLSSCFNRHDS